jgi:hypothetical protein
MEHFNMILLFLGGFFIAISSIKPKNPRLLHEKSEQELEIVND